VYFKSFADHLSETCNCWKGYKRKPGTAPCAEGSCIKEGKRGLWDNIHAKQKRIKAGSGEKMRTPGSEGAPTDAALKASQNEEIQIDESRSEHARTILHHTQNINIEGDHPEGKLSGGALHYTLSSKSPTFKRLSVKHYGDYHHMVKHASDEDLKQMHNDFTKKKVNEEVEAQFDLIESVINELALIHNLDPEYIWEKFEQFTDQELLEYAVDAKGHKSSTGGLTQKGRDAYNAKGANLQAPVTTPPSKLKAGSKAANRRKSFCARMGGMEGPMKKPNGEPSRKALALRKWNC